MIKEILNDIIELDKKKPLEQNNYLSEQFLCLKKLLKNSEVIISCANKINEYINSNNYSRELIIGQNNNVNPSEPSTDEIEKVVSSTIKQIEELSNINNYLKIESLTDKISNNVSLISKYIFFINKKMKTISEDAVGEFDSKRKKLISNLSKEIEKCKNDFEVQRENCNKFLCRTSFKEDFTLCHTTDNSEENSLAEKASYNLPVINKFLKHNFSNTFAHNLLFLHKNSKEPELYMVYEKLFFRLFFNFDVNFMEVQPVGFLPLQLNALFSNLKIGDYSPVNPAILEETALENYFAKLYSEVTERASKYYQYKDFYGYNEANKNNPDKAIIIFINDYPTVANKICNMYIKNLLNSDCYLYGVYFIVGAIEENLREFDIDFTKSEFGFKVFKLNDKTLFYDNKKVDFSYYSETIRNVFFDGFKKLKVNKKEDATVEAAEDGKTSIDELYSRILEDKSTDNYSNKLVVPIGVDELDKTVSVSFETKNEKCSMIVAGTTGSGKSAFLHTLILSACLKYSPSQLNLYLIDFKDGVEFSPYSKNLAFPHLKLISCRNSIADAQMILEKIKEEKIRRNELFKSQNCTNIDQFNKNNPDDAIPRLLIIIDEYQVMLADNSKLGQKCQDTLDALSREVRSTGISLILSSQKCDCGKNVLSQTANRICFKCNKDDATIGNLFEDALSLQKQKELTEFEQGNGYFYNSSEIKKFKTFFTGDGLEKQIFTKAICAKFNEKISFELSNDTRDLSYNENAYGDITSSLVDFGLLVFDNRHLHLDFSLENKNQTNLIMIGKKSKALEVEMSIVRGLNSKVFDTYTYSFIFASRKKTLLESGFLSESNGSSNSAVDLAQKINEFYDEYNSRISASAKGEFTSGDVKVLIINSLNSKILENVDKSSDDSQTSWLESSESMDAKSKLIELYNNSYQFGIYVILHFDSKEMLKEFFGYDRPKYEYAFYLGTQDFNIYLENNYLSSSSHEFVELEERTSVFVKDDIVYKFRRYKFD